MSGKILKCLLGFTILGCLTGCGKEKIEEKKSHEVVTGVDDTKNLKVVSTSVAICEILEKLGVPSEQVVGIPVTGTYKIPSVYEDATTVGSPMNPDLEVISTLKADLILSPNSLQGELEGKYNAIGLKGEFIDLKSVEGMYDSIYKLGRILGKEKEGQQLEQEYEEFLSTYQSKMENKEKPRVLILMGLPGSYVVATPYSYVGNLVQLAGAINVTQENETTKHDTSDFLNLNVEEMLKLDPDIILRTSHAMPQQVQSMFEKEFSQNDVWKHFRAVKEDKVYDLNHDYFGMSAGFDYQEGLVELEQILYE